MSDRVRVRPAVAGDEGAILRMIVALATFEREPDMVLATEAVLHALMFAAAAQVFAQVADANGPAAGLALWFLNFSTWTGRHGIYLEDLIVDPDARRAGVARALFAELAREAARRGCARIDWAVLDWNRSAMDFYASLGAHRSAGWQPWRLEGAALDAIACATTSAHPE